MTMSELGLEERVRSLERTFIMVRIAIIILVGFLMYDVISEDSGSSIVFADKIKSREFVLIGKGNQPVGHWDYKDTYGLRMYSKDGKHVVLTPEAVTFYQDRLNPVVTSKYD